MIRRVPSWSLLTDTAGRYQPASTHTDPRDFAKRQEARRQFAQASTHKLIRRKA